MVHHGTKKKGLEGRHTVSFVFKFDGEVYRFARDSFALNTQNNTYLTPKSLQEAKANAVEVLRRSIENILREI